MDEMIKKIVIIAVGAGVAFWVFSIFTGNDQPEGEHVQIEPPRLSIPAGSSGNAESLEDLKIEEYKEGDPIGEVEEFPEDLKVEFDVDKEEDIFISEEMKKDGVLEIPFENE